MLAAYAGIYGPGRSALDAVKQKVSCLYPLTSHLLLGCYDLFLHLSISTLVTHYFLPDIFPSYCFLMIPTQLHS